MRNLLKRLWREDAGLVVTAEMIFGTALLVAGMIVGMVSLRDQVVQEFGDLSAALESLDQSFHVDGWASYDDPDTASDPEGQEPSGLSVQASPIDEGS